MADTATWDDAVPFIVVYEGKNTKGQRVSVTRSESGDPAHPGRYTLYLGDDLIDSTDAEFMGRSFDVTDFVRRSGIRLPGATATVMYPPEA